MVDRAFDLAREGKCRTLYELRQRLVAEQCFSIEQHLSSQTLRKQFAALMAETHRPGV